MGGIWDCILAHVGAERWGRALDWGAWGITLEHRRVSESEFADAEPEEDFELEDREWEGEESYDVDGEIHRELDGAVCSIEECFVGKQQEHVQTDQEWCEGETKRRVFDGGPDDGERESVSAEFGDPADSWDREGGVNYCDDPIDEAEDDVRDETDEAVQCVFKSDCIDDEIDPEDHGGSERCEEQAVPHECHRTGWAEVEFGEGFFGFEEDQEPGGDQGSETALILPG